MTNFILTILINCIILSVVFNLKVFNLKMVRRKPNKFWDGLHWLFVVFIMGPIVHIGYVLLLIAFEIHSLIKKI
jgi:hypothetical protein